MGILATTLALFGAKQGNTVETKPKAEYSIELIKKFEGFSAKPYKCPAGVWTRGYGSTIMEGGWKVTESTSSVDKLDAEKDVVWYCNTKIVPVLKKKGCYDRLNFNQRSALVDFCYNVGENAFACSTMCKYIANDPNDKKIPAEFLKWIYMTDPATKKKIILKGLQNRRAAESQLYSE